MFCYETSGSYEPRHASPDGVNLNDDKTLSNLLRVSEFYQPTPDYIETIQKNGFPCLWRQKVTHWMHGIFNHCKCEEGVLPHAVNLFDRYCSTKMVECPVEELQVLGATCLFIASKLRETASISVDCLVEWGSFAYSIRDVRKWELEVLNTLNWDTYVVLPHDLLDHFITRLPIPEDQQVRIRDHARVLFNIICSEYSFLRYTFRITAAACLYDAVFGLGPNFITLRNELCKHMQNFVDIEMVEFECAVLAIREYVMSHRDGPDEADNEAEEEEEKVTGTPLNSTPTLIDQLPQ